MRGAQARGEGVVGFERPEVTDGRGHGQAFQQVAGGVLVEDIATFVRETTLERIDVHVNRGIPVMSEL